MFNFFLQKKRCKECKALYRQSRLDKSIWRPTCICHLDLKPANESQHILTAMQTGVTQK